MFTAELLDLRDVFIAMNFITSADQCVGTVLLDVTYPLTVLGVITAAAAKLNTGCNLFRGLPFGQQRT